MWRIILQAIPVLVFSYAAQLLMKRGVNAVGGLTLQAFQADPLRYALLILMNPLILAGFALAAIGAVLYLFLLSKGDFTVVFPILGALGFLALPFIGKFILHESITPARVLGTVVIAVGMLIVARS
jgi:drug/metabolite transporter (DMT)-like permease